jgi:hypothetical protein
LPFLSFSLSLYREEEKASSILQPSMKGREGLLETDPGSTKRNSLQNPQAVNLMFLLITR